MKRLLGSSRSVHAPEKTSLGILLTVVLILGSSVVTWAGVCSTPTDPVVIKEGTCIWGPDTCRAYPPEYTDGNCTYGGTLPCEQQASNLTVKAPFCAPRQEFVCFPTGTPPNITWSCGWKFFYQCEDKTLTPKKGVALPQTTPPCDPPGA